LIADTIIVVDQNSNFNSFDSTPYINFATVKHLAYQRFSVMAVAAF